MLFSDALQILKNDDTINEIVNMSLNKKIIMDRGTKALYDSSGNHFSPTFDEIISEEWELGQ